MTSFESAAEAVIASEHDRLRTGPHTELVEEVRCVIADRLFADLQAFSDVRVAQPVGHERKHLTLSRGQGRERRITYGFLGLQKCENSLLETLPRRFVLEQDVIARVELDKLGSRTAAGHQAP